MRGRLRRRHAHHRARARGRRRHGRQKGLMAMTVAELKEELEARGEVKSGNKAWLRRRLHAAILRVRLRAVRAQRKEIFGSDSSDDHNEDS